MGLGAEGGLAQVLQQLGEGRLCGDHAAQNLGVDEEADQALGFTAGAVGDQPADTNIGLAAVAMQQGLERRQQHHEQGNALTLGKVFQFFAQGSVDHRFQACALMAGLRRIGAVGGQFQHGMFVAQLRAPVVQLPLALTGLQPAALPQRIVAVMHGQGRQRRFTPGDQRVVSAHEFVDQNVHRPAVGDDVMQGQQQHMFLRGQAQQPQTQQWAVLQVEGLGRLGHHVLLRQRPALGLGQFAQVS